MDYILKFNICFIKRGNEILLLNREKGSWMGCWNGIGGKLDPHESPRDAMIREMVEETGITQYDLKFKGLVTWKGDDFDFGGMYAYIAEVPISFDYATPKQTDEGILDWKKIDWIMDKDNVGIVSNIPIVLPMMLNDQISYDHSCVYRNGNLIEINHNEISSSIEWDQSDREQYLKKCLTKQ